MHARSRPIIIQGGMGVGVSDWRLARAVSSCGQLGVVSGTALDAVMVRRLQLGDPGEHLRRALEHLPIPGIARRLLDRYFVPGGKPADQPFASKPLPAARPSRSALELIVASNFVEVFLAKEGHDGAVGINYLEKIQAPTLASLYGAMLAGVSCVLMGAGIPRSIPGALDRLARSEATELALDVAGAAREDRFTTRFDPAALWQATPAPTIARPEFFAIVASASLATMLARRANGRVDGFVIEGPSAGGHNAPPRGGQRLTTEGEPIYGERDRADFPAMRELDLPFWCAGSYGSPERIAEARRCGATGVQVGTAFACCEESGLDPRIKEEVIAMSRAGTARVFTDPVASPTGFPFKVVPVAGSLGDPAAPTRTSRVCDLGYLRSPYRRDDGSLGWRCAAEPVADFVGKGGVAEQAAGRLCLCNGLMASIGLGQVRRSMNGEGDAVTVEPPLVTAGDDVAEIHRFLPRGARTYSAADVIDRLLADLEAPTSA